MSLTCIRTLHTQFHYPPPPPTHTHISLNGVYTYTISYKEKGSVLLLGEQQNNPEMVSAYSPLSLVSNKYIHVCVCCVVCVGVVCVYVCVCVCVWCVYLDYTKVLLIHKKGQLLEHKNYIIPQWRD